MSESFPLRPSWDISLSALLTSSRAKYPWRTLDGTTPSLSMNMSARVWSQTTYMLSAGLTCLIRSSAFMPSRAAVSALRARTSAAFSIFIEPATFEYSASTLLVERDAGHAA